MVMLGFGLRGRWGGSRGHLAAAWALVCMGCAFPEVGMVNQGHILLMQLDRGQVNFRVLQRLWMKRLLHTPGASGTHQDWKTSMEPAA